MPKILITGANGLIGTRLQAMLQIIGYDIHTLGRTIRPAHDSRVQSFIWDVENQKIDIRALEGVDAIIHLAGAGVADKRWTTARKKEILNSRINSTRLLYKTLQGNVHQVKTIISASAVGYYGDCGSEILTEEHRVADTFLAEVTRRWEDEVSRFEKIKIRHVCCRIGIVLSKDCGALPELTKTFPVGFAGYFAKDSLYYPWIHLDDVCGIMIYALQTRSIRGSYNTTAPGPIPIHDLMKAVLTVKRSKAVLVPIPTFALEIALGEMAEMLLSSQRCSDVKILNAGYKFLFPDIYLALKNIYC